MRTLGAIRRPHDLHTQVPQMLPRVGVKEPQASTVRRSEMQKSLLGQAEEEEMKGRDIVNNLMNETIRYGGLPLRRCDVYRDALDRTGSHQAADMFAFGINKPAIDATPLSYDDFRAICGDF